MLFNYKSNAFLIGLLLTSCFCHAENVTINGGEVKFHGLVVAAPCSVKADDINKP